jgi:hypothetical protein
MAAAGSNNIQDDLALRGEAESPGANALIKGLLSIHRKRVHT